ncbi:MAG TPA: glycosyltransferase, partial [Planctomycetes bacterium]|nr:glycosyltransferase [Planctomycetota bacterium]
MKVLILLPRAKPRSLLDDSLLFALARAEALAEMGHRADLVSPEGRGGAWETLGKKIVQAGLPRLGEWTRRGARGRAAFRRKHKEEKYDLAEVVWGGGMELFLPCLEGIPFTARFSGPLLEEPGRTSDTLDRELIRFLERIAGRELAGFTAGSARLAGRVRERLRVSCLYWVVHPGVKIEKYPESGNPPSSPGQGQVLCLLGGEEEEKGRFLADLVGPLLEERKDLSFRVLAGRADSPAARVVEEALGGPDPAPGAFRLEEAPGEEALPGLLKECRAFLVPSFGEGGLYALLCAMASGKPVLVPESPWIYEYVRPEIDGLVLPGGKVEAFRRGLERILDDGKRAAALGKNARGRVEARFRVQETARTSLAFWVHAASLRGRGGPSREGLPLGPGNWFQAWWAGGGPKVSHSLEKGPGGKALLAELSLEELGFLERFLSRAWWEQGG